MAVTMSDCCFRHKQHGFQTLIMIMIMIIFILPYNIFNKNNLYNDHNTVEENIHIHQHFISLYNFQGKYSDM